YPRSLRLLAQAPKEGGPADWAKAEAIGEALDDHPRAGARWVAVPESLGTAQKIETLKKGFTEYLAGVKLKVSNNAKLMMGWDVGESPESFRGRGQAVAWREFEKKLAAEREVYAPEFTRYGVTVPADEPAPEGSPWPERWKPFLRGSPVRRT